MNCFRAPVGLLLGPVPFITQVLEISITSTREVSSRRASLAEPPLVARKSGAPGALPIINQVPTEALVIFACGNGDAGELGRGPAQQEALAPYSNPFFGRGSPTRSYIVQLACGGMHTIALSEDNKLFTWGVNDNCALGRDTVCDGSLRDVDGDPEQQGDLNPLESTPLPIPADHFPLGTKFVQVAAGDSCSFALTDTGLVYGWGTFNISPFLFSLLPSRRQARSGY